jgi:[ribosomal protein S5]-alanine N-acetyltransferase
MFPIQTHRCLLRPFMETDLDDFMAYRNQEHWMRFQGFKGLSKQAYRDVLLTPLDMQAGCQLAITLAATGRLVGDLYIRREEADCHIGYTVAPAYVGQGYATEATTGLLHWLRRQGCLRALASVASDNEASLRVLQRLGFHLDGRDAQGDLLFSLPLGENLEQ